MTGSSLFSNYRELSQGAIIIDALRLVDRCDSGAVVVTRAIAIIVHGGEWW